MNENRKKIVVHPIYFMVFVVDSDTKPNGFGSNIPEWSALPLVTPFTVETNIGDSNESVASSSRDHF